MLRSVSVYASLIVTGASLIILAGWIFDIDLLKGLFFGFVAIPLGTASGFFLTGCSLYIFHKSEIPYRQLISGILAVMIMIFSLIVLLHYIAGTGYWHDRMSPDSAILLFVSAGSLILLATRKEKLVNISQVLALIVVLFSLVPVVCDIYGTPHVFPGYPGPPLPVVLLFLFAGAGIMVAYPRSGIMAVLSSTGMGGYIARRLIPMALLLPVVLVWILLLVDRMEMLVLADDIHLVTAFLVIGFVILSLHFLRSIEAIDQANEKAKDKAYIANRQLRYHIENSPLAMVEWDNEFRVRKWSWQAEQMFGWKLSELAGKRSDEWHFVHEDDREAADKTMSRIIGGKERGAVLPLRNYTKNGELLYCVWYISVLVDRDGEMASILSLVDDVTEKKITEMKLAESEEQYRSLVEISQDAIWINQDNRIVFCNPAAVRLFGAADAGEVLGRNPYDFFREDFHDLIRERIEIVLKGGNVPVIEEKMMKFDGTVIDVEVAASSFTYKRKPAIQVVARDITRRKRDLAKLSQNEFLLRMAGSLAKTGGWMARLSDEKVIWSEQVNAIHEVPPDYSPSVEEAINFYAPEHRSRILKVWNECIQEGKPYDEELRIITAKGNRIWVRNLGVAERDSSGKIVHIVGGVQDITERKRNEEEIRKLNEELEKRVQERTRQLEESNRELEAFSYSISHDLRSPLRAIDGFSRILMEDHSAKLDKEGKRICNTIVENTSRMGRLIDELLAFSRLGRQDIYHTEINMARLVESVYKEVSLPEDRKRIVFNCELSCPGYGDPAMIRQVWANLISNAIKFTSSEREPVITISCSRKNSYNEFCIKDNGVGFDMKYSGRIFEVFKKLHSTREFEGSGVGLSIVQRIVHKHGGTIRAYGEPGGGAEFCFTLPVNQ